MSTLKLNLIKSALKGGVSTQNFDEQTIIIWIIAVGLYRLLFR